MIDAKVIDLLKNPDSLSPNDAALLAAEIKKYPYVQAVRALNLKLIHQYQPEAYGAALSETAAYTTDKKTLYKIVKGTSAEPKEEKKLPENKRNKFEIHKIPEIAELPAPATVYINGQRNRILFEGEEDFMERPSESIDMESTLESGSIVITTPKISDAKDIPKGKPQNEESFGTPELFIELQNPDKINEISEGPELSFHETEDFLPKVQIAAPTPPPMEPKTEQKAPNRHELEMQKLIAEVEAKMKNSKKKDVAQPDEQPEHNSEINFAEHMAFEAMSQSTNSELDTKVHQIEEQPTADTGWKPMNIAFKKPDAQATDQSADSTSAAGEPVRPELNVSFFAENLVPQKELENDAKAEPGHAPSNVPQFLNTWQSWLKMDRKPAAAEEQQPQPLQEEETKSKAIEKFIATEPKISRLKEDTQYTVKERGANISHLMTETLANLYIEQRLYAKAIGGFEILKKKYPEKKKYFEERIIQVKELRQNK